MESLESGGNLLIARQQQQRQLKVQQQQGRQTVLQASKQLPQSRRNAPSEEEAQPLFVSGAPNVAAARILAIQRGEK